MKRLRRSEVIHARQSEFSPILFDVLFGLLIFIGIGSFFDLKGPTHFIFYVTSTLVILHWWLKYKAAQETYGTEASSSTIDLLFGILEIALLQIAMLAAADGNYAVAITFFAMPLVLESVRALLWRFFGKWRHSSAKRVRYIEQELEYTVFLNLCVAFILGAIVMLAPLMTAPDVALCFLLAYIVYAIFTHRLELIDVKLM
jgi:hypothetical protein